MTFPHSRGKIFVVKTESDNNNDSPTTMFGWLPEVAGAALAAGILALLTIFADGA